MSEYILFILGAWSLRGTFESASEAEKSVVLSVGAQGLRFTVKLFGVNDLGPRV